MCIALACRGPEHTAIASRSHSRLHRGRGEGGNEPTFRSILCVSYGGHPPIPSMSVVAGPAAYGASRDLPTESTGKSNQTSLSQPSQGGGEVVPGSLQLLARPLRLGGPCPGWPWRPAGRSPAPRHVTPQPGSREKARPVRAYCLALHVLGTTPGHRPHRRDPCREGRCEGTWAGELPPAAAGQSPRFPPHKCGDRGDRPPTQVGDGGLLTAAPLPIPSLLPLSLQALASGLAGVAAQPPPQPCFPCGRGPPRSALRLGAHVVSPSPGRR